MERGRRKPVNALLAMALLVTIVIPIGFAGAASDRNPTASTGVKKEVKKLKLQVKELRRQVGVVSKQPGPQGPEGPGGQQGAQGPPGPATGPAGGDLTGSFPNPLIAPAAVGTTEIANAAVDTEDLATGAVHGTKIAGGEVDSQQIKDFGVGSIDLQGGSVGGAKLRTLMTATSPGTTVNAGTPGNAVVSCPLGSAVVIGGGFAWQEDEPNSIIYSTPGEVSPSSTWQVRGMVESGSNTLFAWANCLPA